MCHLSPSKRREIGEWKKNCINNDQKLPQAGKINKFTDSGSSVNLKWKKKKKGKESHAVTDTN